jgi:hypothetical protein
MAKAEFYEIVIKNKQDQILVTNISLNEHIKKYLDDNSDVDNFCQKGTCAVLLDEYIETDNNNITYDFTKLTDKRVMSTIISEPSNSEDTFIELSKMKLETTTYTAKEKNEIEELISLHEIKELIVILKKKKINKYKIYKIISDNYLLKDNELLIFENQIIKRLQTDNIYFNIVEKFASSKYNVLVYQNLSDGLEIKFLEEYLNKHLLISESFKVYFHKLYDADFMDLLQNGDLKKFFFSFDLESKNNLRDEKLFNPLYSIASIFGDNLTKVEIKAKEDEILDNKKLIDFFEKASDSGFLNSCELTKIGGGNKKIDFKDKKLNIEYAESIKIRNIQISIEFFKRALIDKDNIIKKRLGL